MTIFVEPEKDTFPNEIRKYVQAVSDLGIAEIDKKLHKISTAGQGTGGKYLAVKSRKKASAKLRDTAKLGDAKSKSKEINAEEIENKIANESNENNESNEINEMENTGEVGDADELIDSWQPEILESQHVQPFVDLSDFSLGGEKRGRKKKMVNFDDD